MIVKFKIFEKVKPIKYYSFSKDFDTIHDVDHYLNILKTKIVYIDEIHRLIWWAGKELPELLVALTDVLSPEIIVKDSKWITKLTYKYFEEILDKPSIREKLLNNKEFLNCLVYYGDVDKFELIKSFGESFTQGLLHSACYAYNLPVVKFLVGEGLDPSIRKKALYSHKPENCLDEATSHNDKPEVIKYLVNLGVPVTYRHMRNVIYRNNFDALECLINSNNIIDDYSASSYATHTEDRRQYTLHDLISFMAGRDLDEYIKILFSKESDCGYRYLQSLPEIKEKFNSKTWEHEIVYLSPKCLELAFWVIKNYNGPENHSTTPYITQNNEKFWFKKMKSDTDIIPKLLRLSKHILESYTYQKLILTVDSKYLKYIINFIHPNIADEFDYLIDANKYNI